MTPLWGQVITGGLSSLGGLLAGAAAMARVRPDNKKARAESERVDAEVHLQLQHATTEAIRNVRAAADEAVRAAREETKRTISDMSILQRKLDSVQAQAEVVEQRLRVTDEELITTRRQNEELRAQSAAERRQLLEQMADERAQHQAAMHQMKLQVQQLRIAGTPSVPGVVLDPDDFGSAGQV